MHSVLRSVSVCACFFFTCSSDHRALHSFPTRRSSDLSVSDPALGRMLEGRRDVREVYDAAAAARTVSLRERTDRKSTRLNSSHPSISYAVFCLKKKNQTHKRDVPLYSPRKPDDTTRYA